jgi:hypothetical protein
MEPKEPIARIALNQGKDLTQNFWVIRSHILKEMSQPNLAQDVIGMTLINSMVLFQKNSKKNIENKKGAIGSLNNLSRTNLFN